jgi:hypothetical protein
MPSAIPTCGAGMLSRRRGGGGSAFDLASEDGGQVDWKRASGALPAEGAPPDAVSAYARSVCRR